VSGPGSVDGPGPAGGAGPAGPASGPDPVDGPDPASGRARGRAGAGDRRRSGRRERPPIGIAGVAALGAAFTLVPFVALLQRTPWSDLGDLVTQPLVTEALRLSLVSAFAATAVALALGVPLAWVLARSSFPGRSLLRAIVTLPMVLPPVVGGTALLFAFGRRGLVGGPVYDATGFLLPFSTWGVIVANSFVAFPFLVITVEAGLRSADRRYEDAAATLGADRWTVLRRVTLPSVAPSILAGALLAWARALGEFGATVTFAGNLQGRTQTMPLAVFLARESDRGAAIALSLVLIAVSLAVLVPLRDRWLGA
jgi:molybdate transport system permease protein